jgi:predicted nuclease of restriction endonuclease-like (RecB) superfamily
MSRQKERLMDKNYVQLVKDIKQRVTDAQYTALKTVNRELITLYWDIGKVIVLHQRKYGWGRSVVEKLGSDLQHEFSGLQGFSGSNLWRMRRFYLCYKHAPNLAPLVREISWTKNIVILEKCKNTLERRFYIAMTRKFGWTKNVLIHQIENRSYEKYLTNQTNFDSAVPAKYKAQAKLAVKDEYIFDFLDLSTEHSEAELEAAVIKNIRKFLAEMGGYFSYIGDQYRLDVDGEDFFIDLLLQHRKLNCLVAIELKIGDFKPEYAGKMQFYLTALDEQVKMPHENQSIGIIVCRQKKRTIVEYSLRAAKKPIGVATYKVRSHLPSKWRALLPSPEKIARAVKSLEGAQP